MLSRFQIFKQYQYSLLRSHPIYCNLTRLLCNKTNSNEIRALEELKERGLLRISGNESFQYMQGLITNDVKHLEEGSRSMYGMFLNNKGRVMYDAIFYKSTKEPAIFVECDKRAVQDLLKHLKMYKVRRKVEIEIMDSFKVYVLYNPNILNEEIHFIELVSNVSQEKIVPCQVTSNKSEINSDHYFLDLNKFNENTIFSTDPRLPQLGTRIITTKNYEELEKKIKDEGVRIESPDNASHKSFRFKLGIGEGIEELPYGKCFPLEMNCDYLHGVSFHKGCYIGQEVTARTHHTGVVRKRLMPIYLDSPIPENTKAFNLDAPIQMDCENGQVVGKLRGACKNIALGLLRISEALKAPKLRIGNLTGSTIKPKWWPQEASKESFSTSR